MRVQSWILCRLCVILILLPMTSSIHNQIKRSPHKKSDKVIDIKVHQKEDLQGEHDDISLHIATKWRHFNLQLRRAPNIFHQEVRTISTTRSHSSGFAHSLEYLHPEVHQIDNHFFHNPQTGSVLSVVKMKDGSHNVEGYLDHNTLIVPWLSNTRQKRSTKPTRHSVYEVDGGSGDFHKYRNRNWKNFGSEEVVLNSLLKKGLSGFYGKEIFIQQFIDNHRDIDWSEEDNEADPTEADDDDDYKEVPAFFQTEETWKAHQRQAEANRNSINDKEEADEKLKLVKILKAAIIKERSNKRNPSFNSRPHIGKESLVLSRLKRSLQIKSREDSESNQENLQLTSDSQDNESLMYHGQTEPNLKQTTTHEIPLQIPRPFPYYDNASLSGHFSLGQIGSWLPETTKLKYPNEQDSRPSDTADTIFDESLFPISNNVRSKRQVPIQAPFGDAVKLNQGMAEHDVRHQKGQFTIEVHAVVDASLYKDFNYNWKTLQLFLLHFWQSVNNRFQAIVNPHVQLKIKAISKIIFPGFQPFIENNRVKSTSDWVDVDKVLEDFKSYVQEQFELNPLVPEHDVAFLMTGENLCKRKADGSWSKKSRGIAFVRGACISARRFQNETYDVGISEVGPSFSGVLTTTHELAHLVGAVHDGEKNALACPPSDGYVMGGSWKDPVQFNRFSQCSKTNMKDFLENAWYANCLVESVDHKNSVSYTFPKQLPGQAFSLEEQCYHFIGGVPCKNVPLSSQCGRLCCEKWSQVFKSREPAADGTRCAGGKICNRGQCIQEVTG